ncbi:ATP-binding protein [Pyxidicoccus fallax]|uniref:ATP-binding protein n=1 Tax=Pyxidicoccus fallax TaxID=394095 RepID=A0A848L855_9BACT|nr:ATP-binding protein [Pyxidicoccus fallax]NMO14794.1 ATP-binding protein [Pyxidicoccus fallax]NPC79968.1 ATP-binding protein [Pyxidicoccus fallax]
MQLTHLRIENFKGIAQLEIPFIKEGTKQVRPLTMLLGDNGSGKTTVLQAMALTLSLATRRTEEPSSFEWPGFLAERVSSSGSTRVELDVRFEADELAATKELYLLWSKAIQPHAQGVHTPPGNHQDVRLVYQDGFVHALQGEGALAQFLGRFFIRYLLRTHPSLRQSFSRVGDVFWFDQHRNLMSLGSDQERGIERLREFLVGWWGFHTSPRRTEASDYLGRLQKRFADLFPGTAFIGVEPRAVGRAPSALDSYFLIERDGRVYDLAEMSSGEQAVFPLLYEFVRLEIARSVVLIDELELHLHPPQQQALLSSLRRIGPNCQFIITSHSPYLESVVPGDEEIRLSGGQRCL